MQKKPTHPLLCSLALGLALTTPLTAAHAADVSATLTFDARETLTGTAAPLASYTVSDATSVVAFTDDTLTFYDAGLWSGWASASANSNGRLTTSASMDADGYLGARSVWSDTITNNSGTTQNYSMSFHLDRFRTFLGGYTYDPSLRTQSGGFLADISVNGVSVWTSGQTFSLNENTFSLATSGVNIGTGQIDTIQHYDDVPSYVHGSYDLAAYDGVANLGSLAAGKSILVTYSYQGFVFRNDPGTCPAECMSGVSANGGDPFDISGSGVTILAAAVPEPESYAMLLAGLGLIGVVARRRKN